MFCNFLLSQFCIFSVTLRQMFPIPYRLKRIAKHTEVELKGTNLQCAFRTGTSWPMDVHLVAAARCSSPLFTSCGKTHYNTINSTTKGKCLFPASECDFICWPVPALIVCFVSWVSTDTGDTLDAAARGYNQRHQELNSYKSFNTLFIPKKRHDYKLGWSGT